MSARNELTSKLYNSIAAFNAIACWDVLRLPQMREYLAEHLADTLMAAEEKASPAAPSESLCQCGHNEKAHKHLQSHGGVGCLLCPVVYGDRTWRHPFTPVAPSAEKASTSPVPTATPEHASAPPYDVLDGEISITGYPPITLSGWHYTELAPDFYGHAYMQIGGWLPEGWPSEDTPAGTQQMAYAHLHGRAVPRDLNVQMESKGYGGPRRFLKIQWRKTSSEPAPVLTVHQERLLAEIRRDDTPDVWSTGPAERLYLKWRVRTARHEARRDLNRLADLGHLTRHGDDTGRRYRLARKDGAR